MQGAAIAAVGLLLAGAAAVFPRVGKTGGDFFQSLEKGTVPITAGTVLVGSRTEEGALAHRSCLTPYRIGVYEVTADEYAMFLTEQGRRDCLAPQFEVRRGRIVPRRGQGRRPVAHVSRDEAVEYCRWLSAKSGVTVRLPTEDEWEWAARGGVVGARYPWGWGAPEGKASFRARRVARVGGFEPNGFGLYDVAGNVFEWCATSNGEAVVRGGSWAERDDASLHVFRRVTLPQDYRGADVGFRIVAEAAAAAQGDG